MSGYRDSSDVWTQEDVLSVGPPAVGPAVFPALAEKVRVCAYDRPGTLRYVDGFPMTDRSTTVSQPRTTKDLVTELHDLLAAADVPEPYLLVGHSLGGNVANLYSRTHPDQVEDVVFVDTFSPSIPTEFGSLWSIYRDGLLNPPARKLPTESMRVPEFERFDLDRSVAQVQRAPDFPSLPVAVLTSPAPFALDPARMPKGLTSAFLDSRYRRAQDVLVALAPDIPQIITNGSDHYVQLSQPDLVVDTTFLVLNRGDG